MGRTLLSPGISVGPAGSMQMQREHIECCRREGCCFMDRVGLHCPEHKLGGAHVGNLFLDIVTGTSATQLEMFFLAGASKGPRPTHGLSVFLLRLRCYFALKLFA